eukprot:4561115-Pleurochrysis_carterae.AAC.3
MAIVCTVHCAQFTQQTRATCMEAHIRYGTPDPRSRAHVSAQLVSCTVWHVNAPVDQAACTGTPTYKFPLAITT